MTADEAAEIPWFRFTGISGLKKWLRGTTIAWAMRNNYEWPKWYEPASWADKEADPDDREVMETIVAAAIRVEVKQEWRDKMWNGKRVYPDYLTISAPPPARHHTLMHPFYDYHPIAVGPPDQGFLTSTGRYVNRVEALEIVMKADQYRLHHSSRNDTELYSEDLW